MTDKKPIYVTMPDLPDLGDVIPYLEQIWNTRKLTNKGPLHEEFEKALAEYLGVEHIALFANGTLALVTALQALRITGEVITTPYSFVATSHSLLWNGIKPVFVDIEKEGFNIDPAGIEAAITPETTAILAVHCYGHPCNTEAIEKIADNYNLKVIYDAAHAFGVEDSGGSILNHGDLSILSFHATKVFNTFEGGAIVCPNEKIREHINHLKNFGFVNEVTVVAGGINGKMNEFSAALGLLQLKRVDQAIEKRKSIDTLYRNSLKDVKGISVFNNFHEKRSNFAYFPILVEPDYPLSRDELYDRLKENNINTRRYFYPLISSFPMYRGLPSAAQDKLPVASATAEKILCLPMYPDLTTEDINRITALIR